jgi:hypothetical protein
MAKTQEELDREAEDARLREKEEAEARGETPVEEKPAEDVDEDGVPWKNRAKELERKLQKEREEREAERAERAVKTEEPALDEEDQWTKQQREIARQEYQKERLADKKMGEILDDLASKDKRVSRFRTQIEQDLSRLSSNLRIHPMAVRKAAYATIGELTSGIEDDGATPKKSQRLAEVGDVSEPKPGGSSRETSVQLTDDEKDYADEKRLWDRFSHEEIRAMYKKRKEKKK